MHAFGIKKELEVSIFDLYFNDISRDIFEQKYTIIVFIVK